jgi:hypothetical protein
MGLTFLTPSGALLALAVVAPLGAYAWLERRGRRLRAALGVAEPPRRVHLPFVLAICGLVGLLALAASQPVLDRESATSARTDAEVFFVVDVSRSMLAAPGRDEPTRIERVKRLALDVRRRLRHVPVGIASLTDRTLPHLFPTPDQASFAATLTRAVDIERPPPTGYDVRATALGALATVATTGFFSRAARKRALVVLTDGETRPLAPERLGALFRRQPAIRTMFVHVWGDDERIYATGFPDPGYRSDPTSRETLERLAAGIGGRAFSESDAGAVAEALRGFIGDGGTRTRVESREQQALAPWVLAASIVPLAFLLWRRNAPRRRSSNLVVGAPAPR